MASGGRTNSHLADAHEAYVKNTFVEVRDETSEESWVTTRRRSLSQGDLPDSEICKQPAWCRVQSCGTASLSTRTSESPPRSAGEESAPSAEAGAKGPDPRAVAVQRSKLSERNGCCGNDDDDTSSDSSSDEDITEECKEVYQHFAQALRPTAKPVARALACK
eukprot:CAMPEP_0179105188 /NCGR_PEP_ID=MMETSP0796-20121207/48841_1 /TAXON_ID=73915 /ORGANISM="Pyrodinium bahamense, Strain pbaha01" /LENGTH=162 /DNA_ID=CAMNT_0020803171 /DNA_START=71 /DNA_END=559 /DNA_ORIENTATION=+